MKIKKKRLSTILRDLYGRNDYQPHIELNREYWLYCAENTPVYEATNKHYNKLRITYLRSGCMFYVWVDAPELPEEFCPVNCIMASELMYAEIDPLKDLEPMDELTALTCYFDDEYTVVKNWPNERETEIDEDKIKELGYNSYLQIKLLEPI